MKLGTVALLSTLGMALTSVSVWALTPESAGNAPRPPVSVAANTAGGGGSLGGSQGNSGGGLLTGWVDAGTKGATFRSGSTLMLEGRLGHPVLAASQDNETFLMLQVRAEGEELARTPAPVNLSIVVDRSRSMEGRRLDNALAAARGIIRRLRDGDTVSVVTYNSDADVIVPATVIDSRSRENISFALSRVEARGHTCISCGIETGLASMGRREGVSRMLLLSDGEANSGIRDVPGFQNIANEARERDVVISTIGVDVDYNERVMGAVAQHSNGRHYFVENEADLPEIFDEEAKSLVRTIANRAQVEVDLADGVEVLEVMDRTFTQRGNQIQVPLGAFARDDEKTLLVRLRVPRGESGSRAVADVHLRYDDLSRSQVGECEGTLTATLSPNSALVSSLDPIVESRLARSETTAALRRANELFSEGDVQAAQRTLGSSRGRIRERRTAASDKANTAQKPKLDADFERQLDALQKAEDGFGAAAAEAAPTSSRKGKAQVRSNAGVLDDFSQ